jgi:hypothetical protein
MADIVGSLFGLSPDLVRANIAKENEARAQFMAQNAPQGYGNIVYGASKLGQNIGSAVQGLFGIEDPQLVKAKNIENALQEVQNELGPDNISDPTQLYPTLAKKLSSLGYGNEATQVSLVGQKEIQDWNKKTAEALKTKTEIENENKFRADIIAEQERLGRPLTGDELRNIGVKYAKPQEIIASADKEAYRDLQIQMMELRNENKVNEAVRKGMNEKDLLKYKADLEKDVEKFKADLKEGITNANTSPQIDRLIGAATQATEDLKNVTAFGDRLATTRSYAGFKTGGGGWLNATKDALSQNLIDTDSQQMEVLYKGFSRAAAVVDAQGAATGLVGLQKSLESLAPGPNDSIQTVYTKLAQSRQIIDKGIKAVLAKGKDIKPEQKQLLEDLQKDLSTAVPFTVTDVIKLGGSKTGVTLGDIMGKPSGTKEQIIDGKVYTNDGKGWKEKK